jgi:DNA-binding MarR family transcriptional regulator
MELDGITASEIGQACVFLGVSKAARRLTRRYDEALRSCGLTSGQFSILTALLRDEAMPVGSLAEALGMDRTTLNRNLKPLEMQHFVATERTHRDARVRGLRLTEAGHARLGQALPLWRKVQADSHRRLGNAEWPALQATLRSLG